jgi:hypothetical protein
VERRDGKAAPARTTLGEVEALAAEIGSGPDSELGQLLERLRSALA